LEPIGPAADRARTRRRRGAIAAGLVGVCTAGAAAGLYLKPNLEPSPNAAARSEASGPRVDANAGPDRLAEAQALQVELGSALDQAGLYPAVVTGPAGGPVTAPPPAAGYELPVSQPANREPMSLGQRAAAVYRSISTADERAARPEPQPTRLVRPPPTAVAARQAPPPPVILTPPPSRPAPPTRIAPLTRQEIRPGPAAPPPPIIAPSPPPRGPSFDCSTVRSAAEDMVCSDARLADLDRQMATELMGAMAAGHRPDLLLRDQNDWLHRRDRAAPDPRAVADAYQRRIGQLRSMQ
jgi:hypothetical protein